MSLSISLYGPVRITDADEADKTPRGDKTQALVALLMTGNGQTRTRAWLKAKLWSDRAPDQASGSLRQAIYELRLALGTDDHVLIADRQRVALDPGGAQCAPRPEGPGHTFLEGLDVNDPEFSTWLTEERAARSDPGPTPPGPALALHPIGPLTLELDVAPVPDEDAAVVQACVDALARELEERALAAVRLVDDASTGSDTVDIALSFRFLPDPRLLRCEMRSRRNGRHLFAQSLHLPNRELDVGLQIDFARLMVQAIEAVTNAALRQAVAVDDSTYDMHRAVRGIFGFSARDIQMAEDLLARFGPDTPAALGWQVFLRMVAHVERVNGDSPDFEAELDELVQRALAAAPRNTIVLAAASHACIKVLDRPDDAVILAERALRESVYNPFALDVLADALLLKGRHSEALAAAKTAQRVGQSTSMSHFFDMGLCLAHVANGNLQDALVLARQAAALSPSFRPALRYATILNAALGDLDAAQHSLRRLQKIEPDFSIARVQGDHGYPVATLRSAGVTDAPRLTDLG